MTPLAERFDNDGMKSFFQFGSHKAASLSEVFPWIAFPGRAVPRFFQMIDFDDAQSRPPLSQLLSNTRFSRSHGASENQQMCHDIFPAQNSSGGREERPATQVSSRKNVGSN